MSGDYRKILCCGVCVLDIIQILSKYPKEDSDIRQVTFFKYIVYQFD